MAKFKNIVPCPPEDTSFFSNMQQDAESYSCQWDTKVYPDDDFESTLTVYEQVLATYNISIDNINGKPTKGTLPGMDINRMSAIDAIKLSLAESLLLGEWWEIVEDSVGGVHFQLVYDNGLPGKTIALNPRLCIPSTEKKNTVDMVAVTGYDPPPCRYAGDFRVAIPDNPGQVNPLSVPEEHFTVDFADMVAPSCHGYILQTECIKVYNDPLFNSIEFGSQIANPFYDVKAFETIKGWAVRVTGIPQQNGVAPNIEFHFNTTSTWHYRLPGPLNFVRVSDATVAEFACNDGGGDTQGGTVTFYQDNTISIPNPKSIDRYGDVWPVLKKPNVVTLMGYKIDSFVDFSAFPGGKIFVFVEPKAQFLRQTEGSDWTFELDGDNFRIKPYYQPKVDPDWWEYILAAVGGGSNAVQFEFTNYKRGWNTFGNDEAPGEDSDQQFTKPVKGIIQNGTKLGFLVTDYWIGFEVERPCVVVKTNDSTPARQHCDDLKLEYAPIVIKDAPPEFAYKYRKKEGGTEVVRVPVEEQARFLPDNDPTTCQNFEETPSAVMQDRMQGNVINITLPFCVGADACATVAETIFDYQTYDAVQVVSLTCGPEDEPELGAAVLGYETNLRIESINYSYSDGSSYTIEVTLGPIFSNIGSWNTTTWAPKVEQKTRPAKVVWAGGDGVNYRVDVQGLGVYNAINADTSVWSVGETVTATVYNLPVEA